MLLFGVLFGIAGLLFLVSPVLPANREKQRVEKAILVLIGIFFVFRGAAEIAGVENHPITIGVVVVLVGAVVVLSGYNKLSGDPS